MLDYLRDLVGRGLYVISGALIAIYTLRDFPDSSDGIVIASAALIYLLISLMWLVGVLIADRARRRWPALAGKK